MRVIAGQAGGTKLKSIKGNQTRPTQDRIKEAIFNILIGVMPGKVGLDLFSGFGGLGLEALSRGAQHVTFVERNHQNADIIKQNIAKCKFEENTTVVIKDVFAYLKSAETEFGLIFMDPPYEKGYINQVLQLICSQGLLKDRGLVVTESSRKDSINPPPQIHIIKEKIYGGTKVVILEMKEEENNGNTCSISG